jgi:hypothetical protein
LIFKTYPDNINRAKPKTTDTTMNGTSAVPEDVDSETEVGATVTVILVTIVVTTLTVV